MQKTIIGIKRGKKESCIYLSISGIKNMAESGAIQKEINCINGGKVTSICSYKIKGNIVVLNKNFINIRRALMYIFEFQRNIK